MYSANNSIIKRICFTLFLIGSVSFSGRAANNNENDLVEQEQEEEVYEEEEQRSPNSFRGRRIADIIVSGLDLVPVQAVLDLIPYRVGELFDVRKTRALIHKLYYDLQRFRNISVYAKDGPNDSVILRIDVEEKPLLHDAVLVGNKQVTEKEIREKVSFAAIQAIDEQDVKNYARAINKVYKDRGFHNTHIGTTFEVNEKNQATATFTITEHKKSLVKKISFCGNESMSGKQLRSVIFTREDWILGFMDKAGMFQYDRIDADKHMLVQHYQNHGFINAKVVDVDIDIDECAGSVYLTYHIIEGDKYTVSDVSVCGNDILKDEYLESMVPIKPGDVYSREEIVNSIKMLEYIWGDMGYVYASIDPSIIPNQETKTVSISFKSELGCPVYLNKLTIKGNRKTRDKVIRRKISLEEGGLITNRHLDGSKSRVESLGYFDQRDGVNWKMTRLDENTADLDLMLKETKTGSAHIKLGFGGVPNSMASPYSGVSVEVNTSDTNLMGTGIRYNLAGRLSGGEKTITFNLTQPWLFDKPVFGSMDLYHTHVSYDEFTQTRPVNEKHSGGVLTSGFVTGTHHKIFADTFVRFSVGIDDIRYESRSTDGKRESRQPEATLRMDSFAEQMCARESYNIVLARLFDPGTFVTFTTQMGRDTKNHPMHPSRGYAWLARSVFAIPSFNSGIGFHKFDLDINWFTPLIGDFDLIFRVHLYAGLISPFKNRYVPYRELFHIGGPSSVRGFLFGQISPQFTTVYAGRPSYDSIGAKKTIYLNTELIFPITKDFSMKGVVFYDGGSGWDNPYSREIPQRFLKNNSFSYRHAVGVGIRLLQPMPIKVDWGFKLDPRKGEPASEVHFGMTYDW
jgi:outer membrane protein insertion porin family